MCVCLGVGDIYLHNFKLFLKAFLPALQNFKVADDIVTNSKLRNLFCLQLF